MTEEKEISTEELDILIKEFVRAFDPKRILLRRNVPESERIDHCRNEICVVVDDSADAMAVQDMAHVIVLQTMMDGLIGSHGIFVMPSRESAFLKPEGERNSLVTTFLKSGEVVYDRP